MADLYQSLVTAESKVTDITLRLHEIDLELAGWPVEEKRITDAFTIQKTAIEQIRDQKIAILDAEKLRVERVLQRAKSDAATKIADLDSSLAEAQQNLVDENTALAEKNREIATNQSAGFLDKRKMKGDKSAIERNIKTAEGKIKLLEQSKKEVEEFIQIGEANYAEFDNKIQAERDAAPIAIKAAETTRDEALKKKTDLESEKTTLEAQKIPAEALYNALNTQFKNSGQARTPVQAQGNGGQQTGRPVTRWPEAARRGDDETKVNKKERHFQKLGLGNDTLVMRQLSTVWERNLPWLFVPGGTDALPRIAARRSIERALQKAHLYNEDAKGDLTANYEGFNTMAANNSNYQGGLDKEEARVTTAYQSDTIRSVFNPLKYAFPQSDKNKNSGITKYVVGPILRAGAAFAVTAPAFGPGSVFTLLSVAFSTTAPAIQKIPIPKLKSALNWVGIGLLTFGGGKDTYGVYKHFTKEAQVDTSAFVSQPKAPEQGDVHKHNAPVQDAGDVHKHNTPTPPPQNPHKGHISMETGAEKSANPWTSKAFVAREVKVYNLDKRINGVVGEKTQKLADQAQTPTEILKS